MGLKELADQLATPFCSIFNQSIHDGRVPEIWKKAHVSPIPKMGDKSLVSNHIPISLLGNVDKVFERVIFKHLYNHLLDNSILTAFQSGFIPGDSTINQLTFLYDAFCRALVEGKEVRWCSVISAKLSTECGIKVLFVNWKLLVSQAPSFNGLLIT